MKNRIMKHPIMDGPKYFIYQDGILLYGFRINGGTLKEEYIKYIEYLYEK